MIIATNRLNIFDLIYFLIFFKRVDIYSSDITDSAKLIAKVFNRRLIKIDLSCANFRISSCDEISMLSSRIANKIVTAEKPPSRSTNFFDMYIPYTEFQINYTINQLISMHEQLKSIDCVVFYYFYTPLNSFWRNKIQSELSFINKLRINYGLKSYYVSALLKKIRSNRNSQGCYGGIVHMPSKLSQDPYPNDTYRCAFFVNDGVIWSGRTELNVLDESSSKRVLIIKNDRGGDLSGNDVPNVIFLNDFFFERLFIDVFNYIHLLLRIFSAYVISSNCDKKWSSSLLSINLFTVAKYASILKKNSIKHVFFSDYMEPAFCKSLAARVAGASSYHYNRTILFSEPDYASVIYADAKIYFSDFEERIDRLFASSYNSQKLFLSKNINSCQFPVDLLPKTVNYKFIVAIFDENYPDDLYQIFLKEISILVNSEDCLFLFKPKKNHVFHKNVLNFPYLLAKDNFLVLDSSFDVSSILTRCSLVIGLPSTTIFISVGHGVHVFIRDFTHSVTNFLERNNVLYENCLSIFTKPIAISDIESFLSQDLAPALSRNNSSDIGLEFFSISEYPSISSYIQRKCKTN